MMVSLPGRSLFIIAVLVLFSCKPRAEGLSVTQRALASETAKTIEDALQNAEFAAYAMRTGIITGLTAKNACTCYFVDDGDGDPQARWAFCKARAGMYNSNFVVTPRLGDNMVSASGYLTGHLYGASHPSPIDPIAIARYRGKRLGCTLERPDLPPG